MIEHAFGNVTLVHTVVVPDNQSNLFAVVPVSGGGLFQNAIDLLTRLAGRKVNSTLISLVKFPGGDMQASFDSLASGLIYTTVLPVQQLIIGMPVNQQIVIQPGGFFQGSIAVRLGYTSLPLAGAKNLNFQYDFAIDYE